MKKIGAYFLIVTYLCLMLVSNNHVSATNKNKVIRVGFPMQIGITEKDKDGKYSGYTYDYLQEIAQYTGWEYEFVEVPGDINTSFTTMLKMLEKGEIDLLGAINCNESTKKMFDFPKNCYGTVSSTLAVLDENKFINEFNYQTFENMRIAVLKNTKNRNMELEKFCDTNNIKRHLVYCNDDKEQISKMKEGKADAMLNSDLAPVDGVRNVAKFSGIPYYFATTKGNSDIIKELDKALIKINESDSYFSIKLYEKYFNKNFNELNFNIEEKDYIKNSKPIKVLVIDGGAPFQYFDEKTKKTIGISIDLLKRISKDTGLKFEYINEKDYNKINDVLLNQKVDMIAGIPYNYEFAKKHNVSLTRSYVSSQIVMILNKNSNLENLDGKTIATIRGHKFNDLYNNEKTISCDSVEQCISAINDKKADYGYGNAYSVEYYVSNFGYNNIRIVPQMQEIKRVCFGITKPVDQNLLSIINKYIRYIPNEEMKKIVLENTLNFNKTLTLGKIISSNPKESVIFIIALATLIICVIFFMLHTKLEASNRRNIDNEKYKKLSELMNELLYEYDFEKDTIIFSPKCAKTLGCEQIVHNYYKNIKDDALIDDELKQLIVDIKNSVLEDKKYLGEFVYKNLEGKKNWYQLVATLVENSKANPVYMLGKLIDISEEKKEKEELIEKCRIDGLTKIYNSATSKEMIANLLKNRCKEQKDAFMIVDIDHFKYVNDKLGHYTGDLILQEFSDTLKNFFRQLDVVGRLGGDEFIIYMRNISDKDMVQKKCDELCKIVNKKEIYEGKEHTLSISLGGIIIKDDLASYEFDELYKKADEILYKVKQATKNAAIIEEL